MRLRPLPRLWRTASALLATLALLACAAPVAPPPAPPVKPSARPPRPAAPTPPVVAQPTSQRSAMLRSYLHEVEQAQLTQGLLRTDGGGPDTPFSAEMLARDFEQIAFYNEYEGAFTGKGGASPLRRWAEPVRMAVIFGDSVPPSQQRETAKTISAYASRLGRVTGHPVTMSDQPNFIVVVASEDDRTEMLAEAARRVPGVTPSSLIAMDGMRRDTYCAVAAYAAGPMPDTYTAAVAVLRSENPDLLLKSCIHEELAQGMGLANDSPSARPSIFNDDDEFALLTTHDELLLKMLYDPRLHIGMTAEEASATVREIARELTGEPA